MTRYTALIAANRQWTVGDASKAERALEWRAHTHVPELAKLMVEADLARVER